MDSLQTLNPEQQFAPPPIERVQGCVAQLVEREPELASRMPDPDLFELNSTPDRRASEMVAAIFETYADRPALGERAYELVVNPGSGKSEIRLLDHYRTLSYRETWERVQALANVWNGDPSLGLVPGSMACVLGFATTDHVLFDLACVHRGVIEVPVQPHMRADDLATIFEDTRPTSVAVSIGQIERIGEFVVGDGRIRNLIAMDYEPGASDQRASYEAARATIKRAGGTIHLTSLQDLIARGRTMADAAPHVAPAGEDPLATVHYTSGSTGTPKGVMRSDAFLRRWWSSPSPPIPNVSLCYLPLNHGMGRMIVINGLKGGGTCYFVARSDMSTLLEDARLVRPTTFEFVPRVAELIYHHFQSEMARLLAQPGGEHSAVRAEVIRDMRANFLGGRLVTALIGSAPARREIVDFIEECFEVSLDDIYGGSEMGGVVMNGQVLRTSVLDYKLRDVPELDYYTTDKPFARGELLVKLKVPIVGYFKNPELTDALFEDGYVVTGDIFEERGPDHLVYIDRRKNALKLANGEFVAVAALEALFAAGDPLIHQIYLYGDSRRSYLLAVVVPDLEEARRRLGRTPEEPELKRMLRAAMSVIGRAEQLRSYEIPREMVIEYTPFSTANGLLASLGKHLRPALRAKYEPVLQALYEEIDGNQLDAFASLDRDESCADVKAVVRRVLALTLGFAEADISDAQRFGDLGGDSLAAISLCMRLEDIFGIELPVGVVLNPAADLNDVADYIERALAGESPSQATFASVHGESAGVVRADELKLERFIDAGTLAAVPPPCAPPVVQTVLLTGANGFLGRFLLTTWLGRVAPEGGKVIALVRGDDVDAARRRIESALSVGDGASARRLAGVDAGRLEVLAGDLAAPRLGLEHAEFARLADEVDLIVHAGALVNHVFPYRQLFAPNVVGTAELIRLALTRRVKPFDFVSSMSVSYSGGDTHVGEDEDVRTALPERVLDSGGHPNGYGVSKWAGEVLLREAHKRFGLPVNVFRSDMILAHSEDPGQINVPDVFSRLLISVARTGLAPKSFYELDANDERVRGHYDGIPVDFTADAMVGISMAGHLGFRTYNFVNANNDGVSLDQIVDWIAQEGYPITYVPHYFDWLDKFEAALRELPDNERQRSSLAVLHHLRQPGVADSASRTPTARFREAVRRLDIGGLGEAPPLTRAYIRKCLEDLRLLNLIEPVEARAAE